MATAPYGIRLIVGAAVTAIEESRKLPQTIAMYPMTVASGVAQAVMKMQQDLAGLIIKGDAVLETMFPPKDEKPDWATFDEDLTDQDDAPSPNGERHTEGRFALYSVTDPAAGAERTSAGAKTPAKNTSAKKKPATATKAAPKPAKEPAKPAVKAPAIVAKLDYESLTLAQLRARIQSLSVADLQALLAFEEAGKARAPFQTLLANRITRATAK